MKLLILTQKLEQSDPALGFFIAWIKEFSRQTHHATVICLEKDEYDLPKDIEILSLGKEEGGSRIKYIYRFYKYIWRERKNYDAVFIHMNQIYVVLGGLFWRFWNKKIGLWYAHGSTSISLWLAEKLTHFVFTSTPKSFRLKSSKKIVLGHGIDTDYFKSDNLRQDDKIFSIITVGRVSPVKKIETLLEAAKILKDKGYKFKFLVVGGPALSKDEAYFENLKQDTASKNLQDNISFLGPLPHSEIKSHLERADLFVSVSKTGSLDKALLEAMASGLPIVSSNDAIKEILPDNIAPMQTFEGDGGVLADKISKIIGMPRKDRQALGESLRLIVIREHNLRGLIEKIIQKLGNRS